MNPIVQYILKALIVVAGLALGVTGHLSLPLAGLLSSGLVALGMTNGASIIAQAAQLGGQLPPPSKAPAVVPPLAVLAFAAAIGLIIGASACAGQTAPQLKDMTATQVKAFCAAVAVETAAQDSLDAGRKGDGP